MVKNEHKYDFVLNHSEEVGYWAGLKNIYLSLTEYIKLPLAEGHFICLKERFHIYRCTQSEIKEEIHTQCTLLTKISEVPVTDYLSCLTEM